MKSKFKHCEAIVFDPEWWDASWSKHYEGSELKHPLEKGEIVYFLGEIPNAPGHCVVAKYEGNVVSMVHTDDFRKATEEEV